MAKMGFKAGQGLGKSEQGISSALTVEKTSHRGGKIIEANTSTFLQPSEFGDVENQNMPGLGSDVCCPFHRYSGKALNDFNQREPRSMVTLFMRFIVP